MAASPRRRLQARRRMASTSPRAHRHPHPQLSRRRWRRLRRRLRRWMRLAAVPTKGLTRLMAMLPLREVTTT